MSTPEGVEFEFRVIDRITDSKNISFTIGNFRTNATVNITAIMLCPQLSLTKPTERIRMREYMLNRIYTVTGGLHLVNGWKVDLNFEKIIVIIIMKQSGR